MSRDMNGKEVTSDGGNEIPEGLTDKERLILEIISKGEFDSIRGVSERLSMDSTIPISPLNIPVPLSATIPYLPVTSYSN